MVGYITIKGIVELGCCYKAWEKKIALELLLRTHEVEFLKVAQVLIKTSLHAMDFQYK